MRILHCIPSVEGGGAERQLTYLAGALARRGCDVHVALTRGGAYFDRLRASGATVHQLGPCGTHDPRLPPRLFRTIKRVAPDIVQCWLLQMEVLGGLASLATGTPWLFSERSSAGAYPATMKNRLRVGMAGLASGIVANSEAGKDYWETRVSRSVPRYVVKNGLPLDEIDAAPAAAPEELGGAPGDALILSAGRFDDGKNAAALVHAISFLDRARRARALLCGDGAGRVAVENLVAELGLTGTVKITGFAPNLWNLLKGATMLVSPSRFEGSPNVVLEAMACGCPLVVSDIAAHRELLDEHSALFVSPDDPRAIARAVEQIIGDPAAASGRAAAARARARGHGLPVVAQQYQSVYEDVLSRTRRPREQKAS
jgi:glycosyltransferase involved in cell wall biosynthesis